ncbi:hypothetical protein CP532_0146 [Ophiocordyceps camponoti-leonardi (nom. inval.)]|nr:hypothetical protein CP532_0146 [Ophiocordyceps camponoti-leonardi (nom. inval.)]
MKKDDYNWAEAYMLDPIVKDIPCDEADCAVSCLGAFDDEPGLGYERRGVWGFCSIRGLFIPLTHGDEMKTSTILLALDVLGLTAAIAILEKPMSDDEAKNGPLPTFQEICYSKGRHIRDCQRDMTVAVNLCPSENHAARPYETSCSWPKSGGEDLFCSPSFAEKCQALDGGKRVQCFDRDGDQRTQMWTYDCRPSREADAETLARWEEERPRKDGEHWKLDYEKGLVLQRSPRQGKQVEGTSSQPAEVGETGETMMDDALVTPGAGYGDIGPIRPSRTIVESPPGELPADDEPPPAEPSPAELTPADLAQLESNRAKSESVETTPLVSTPVESTSVEPTSVEAQTPTPTSDQADLLLPSANKEDQQVSTTDNKSPTPTSTPAQSGDPTTTEGNDSPIPQSSNPDRAASPSEVDQQRGGDGKEGEVFRPPRYTPVSKRPVQSASDKSEPDFREFDQAGEAGKAAEAGNEDVEKWLLDTLAPENNPASESPSVAIKGQDPKDAESGRPSAVTPTSTKVSTEAPTSTGSTSEEASKTDENERVTGTIDPAMTVSTSTGNQDSSKATTTTTDAPDVAKTSSNKISSTTVVTGGSSRDGAKLGGEEEASVATSSPTETSGMAASTTSSQTEASGKPTSISSSQMASKSGLDKITTLTTTDKTTSPSDLSASSSSTSSQNATVQQAIMPEEKAKLLLEKSQDFHYEIRGDVFIFTNITVEAAAHSWRLIITVQGDGQSQHFELCEPRDHGRVITRVSGRSVYGRIVGRAEVSGSGVSFVCFNAGPKRVTVGVDGGVSVEPVDDVTAKDVGVPTSVCDGVGRCSEETCLGDRCGRNVVTTAEEEVRPGSAQSPASVIVKSTFQPCDDSCFAVSICTNGGRCSVHQSREGVASPAVSTKDVRPSILVADVGNGVSPPQAGRATREAGEKNKAGQTEDETRQPVSGSGSGNGSSLSKESSAGSDFGSEMDGGDVEWCEE